MKHFAGRAKLPGNRRMGIEPIYSRPTRLILSDGASAIYIPLVPPIKMSLNVCKIKDKRTVRKYLYASVEIPSP